VAFRHDATDFRVVPYSDSPPYASACEDTVLVYAQALHILSPVASGSKESAVKEETKPELSYMTAREHLAGMSSLVAARPALI
jgi:hypothetical protein